MNLNPFRRRRPEHRNLAQLYAVATLDALTNQQGGIRSTAAANAAAGMVSRAFSLAEVPAGLEATLTPEFLGIAGRALIIEGELVADIMVDEGNIRLVVASDCEITGQGSNPMDWQYTLTLPAPTGHRVVRRSGEAVVHLKHTTTPAKPWQGVSPLDTAVTNGRLLGNLVEALRDEAGGPRGSFLPVAQKDGADSTLSSLRDSIGKAGGRLLMVESQSQSYGAGGQAPRQEYEPRRFGFNAPPSMLTATQMAERCIYAVCGIPPALIDAGEGTAMREGYRQLLFGTVSPLGTLAAAELARKLEMPVSLDWTELRASDISGRARAFQSLVGGGMDLERAAALSGLLAAE